MGDADVEKTFTYNRDAYTVTYEYKAGEKSKR